MPSNEAGVTINLLNAGQKAGLLAGLKVLNGKITATQLNNKLANLWQRDPSFGNPDAAKKRAKKLID